MSSSKNKKPRRYPRTRVQLKTLFAVALMLGAILAGLLIFSYQPGNKNSVQETEQALDPESIKGLDRTSYLDSDTRDQTITVRGIPPLPPPLSAPEPVQHFIAIIMDDLGANTDAAERVAKLDISITMAIIPNLLHARETMQIASRHGKEVMVHLPMEPLDYPRYNPGKMALMLNMTEAEIESRTAYYLHKLPLAKGCNNHMGSAFTQEPHQMAAVLKQLSKRGLFFIDSLTISSSVGAEQARKGNVPSATRDIFLDNEKDVAKITEQFTKLLRIAQKKGSAIGICHPYNETIIALDSFASLAAEYGVAVLPASKLVH